MYSGALAFPKFVSVRLYSEPSPIFRAVELLFPRSKFIFQFFLLVLQNISISNNLSVKNIVFKIFQESLESFIYFGLFADCSSDLATYWSRLEVGV